jgi:hypothetical protein
MIDTRFMTTEPESAAPVPVPAPAPGTAEPLEERVRRLEDAVAALQDTRGMEDRVVERLAERVTRPPAPPGRGAGGALVDAGRRLLPAAVKLVESPPETQPAPAALPVTDTGSRWLVFDAYDEARTIVRMMFDRRYRSWVVRLIPVAVLCLLLFSAFFLHGIFVVGWLLGRAFDLVVVFVATVALSRKARQYRAALAQANLPAGR